jgi:hypothetical protein
MWSRRLLALTVGGFPPESLGNLQCIDVEILPPGDFIAGLM